VLSRHDAVSQVIVTVNRNGERLRFTVAVAARAA
jgi:hypothetical protein